MARRNSLQAHIEDRIAHSGDDVFLTREFRDLGGERQVRRALRKLVDEGTLVRLGYGAYAKTEISPLTQQPMLAGDGFGPVARQLLDKLHVAWEPTVAERAYNEGRSTQVPMNAVVRVKGRFSRRLGYRGQALLFER